MSDKRTALPRYYWVIAIVALLWNLIGVFAYVSQVTMTAEAIHSLPLEQQSLYTDVPAWATSAYAIAVTAGTIGCILLLLRNAWAVPVFLASLAGVLVQMYHAFVIAGAYRVLGPFSLVMPTLIVAIGIALIWFSRIAKEKRWIS
ncbi:MAG: hypothetical protein OEW35_03705 [Gammaproteobacteria bacterium]|nr:hypothetical protein [Gammaproteobacteria bacterium]MDH5309949.1 hypothetical protein [Gammaproteobacteria bacterium]